MARQVELSDMEELAILGHAIADERVYDALVALQTPLRSPYVQPILQRIGDHHKRLKRHPSPDEILAAIVEDDAGAAAFKRNLDNALKYRQTIGWDTLAPGLRMLAERKLIVDGMAEANVLFNKSVEVSNKNGLAAGDELHAQTLEKITQTVTQLGQIQAIAEGQRFRPMTERVAGLSATYKGRQDRVIPTGIQYLDDASGGGIGVNDLWIFSATTGSGKTQAMIEIAKSAAKAGKRVSFFALEADDREMEARILFPTLLRLFNENPANRGTYVDPVKWLRGDAETHRMLDPFVERAEAEAARDLAQLRTMYLGFGKYRAKDLERDILARSKDSDLLVIDHLGYIALDEGNENKETTDLLFLLRDLVKLDRGVPIITACHTRKSDNRTPKKFSPLIPDRNDIRGSGAITQCATAVVMLAKVREPVHTVDNAVIPSPTIIQMQKDRRDGRDEFAAVCSFNVKTRTYAPTYGIGRLTKGDTAWLPVNRPPWATHATANLQPFGAVDQK